MLATSSTRQTYVENPSAFWVLRISLYWGMYGTTPPNMMATDAIQDTTWWLTYMIWSITTSSIFEWCIYLSFIVQSTEYNYKLTNLMKHKSLLLCYFVHILKCNFTVCTFIVPVTIHWLIRTNSFKCFPFSRKEILAKSMGTVPQRESILDGVYLLSCDLSKDEWSSVNHFNGAVILSATSG